MQKVFFVLFLLLQSPWLVNGQTPFKVSNVSETMSYKSMADDLFGRQIISMLASSFNLSTQVLQLKPEGTLHVEVIQNELETAFLRLLFYKRTLEGDVVFKGFVADSVLWPARVGAKVQLFNGRHLRAEINIVCPTDGQPVEIEVSEFISGQVGELSIRVLQPSYSYEQDQVERIKGWIEYVETYYSFHRYLSEIDKRYRRYATDNERSYSNVWIERMELERLSWIMNQLKIEQILHLKTADPAGYLPLKAKMVRYSKRASTLFNQTISNGNKVDKEDALTFCGKYIDLSVDCMLKAKKLQPADAIIPNLMASVSMEDEELRLIQEIVVSMSKAKAVNDLSIPQCISKQFVSTSEKFMDAENFADALLLLNNASVFQNTFNIISDGKFENMFLHAFEGVASSYLRVGRMAALTGNGVLSQTYFQRAGEMFDANQPGFKQMSKQDSVMPSFFKEVVQVCQLPDDHLSPGEKLSFLEKAAPLVDEFGSSWLPDFNREFQKVIIRVFNQKVSLFDVYLSQKQYPDAGFSLQNANHFFEKYHRFLSGSTKRLCQLSSDLYHVYINQSDELLFAGQPGIALEQLELAKKMGNWLPPGGLKEIVSRIDGVVIPLIEEKISKVEFEIWAMRLTEAEVKLQEVDSIEQLYLDGKNPMLLQLIRETRFNLQNRVCVSAQQKLDNSVNECFVSLKNRSFTAAVKALQLSNNWVVSNKYCELDTLRYTQVKSACLPLITYLDEMKAVKLLLFSQGYNVAIDRYVNLKKFASENNLDTLGIQLPALYTFVGEQRLPLLTKATATYYANKGKYLEALQYLWLCKDQKLSKSDVRSVMRQVAAGLADADHDQYESVDAAIEKYTSNDQYFNYFKFIYRKNRLL